MIKKRDIVSLILLSIITCGIYWFIFMYQLSKDLNEMNKDGEKTDPTLAILLTIVTFGIYNFIWYYIEGNRIKKIGTDNKLNIYEDGTTYLVWQLLGTVTCGLLSLYGTYLFINNFNKLVDNYNK